MNHYGGHTTPEHEPGKDIAWPVGSGLDADEGNQSGQYDGDPGHSGLDPGEINREDCCGGGMAGWHGGG